MSSIIEYLFGAASFMPHGYCLLWRPDLVAMHGVADALTAISYFSIPAVIHLFIRRRHDLHYTWLAWLFIAFISACGMTHLIGLATIWQPVYGLEGLAKLATAGVSVATAALMWPLLPKALAVPSPAQLREANALLQTEVLQRQQAEDELREAHRELEHRVEERTRALREANEKLAGLNADHELALLRLRSILDNTLDALITTDEAGVIEDYNPACERIFGYRADEVIGQNVRLLMNLSDTDRHDDYMQQFLTTGKARIIGTPREVEGRRKDGSLVPLELSIGEIQLENRRLFSGILRDITERKEAEARRNDLLDRLRRSNQELEQFAYIASHDLKEPLRAVQTHADLLLEDYGDKFGDDGRQRLNRLVELGGRMEHLIADLLEFARLGQEMDPAEAVDLNGVITDIREILRETLRERNAKLVLSTALPNIRGHHPHIMALFQNLIGNGVKYNNSDEKIIEIGMGSSEPDESRDGFETVFVRDNGIGIEKKYQDDVFRIFRRLTSEKEYGPGTGAGLSFVKKITENLGGKIWLRSTPGEGTTFFINLPTAEETANPRAELTSG